MPGMRIVEAGGQKIERYHDFDRIVEQGEGKPVEVVFEEIKAKEGQAKRRATIHLTSTASLVPKKLDKDTLIYHLAGLVPAVSIKAVEEKSPADQAGVKSGDLIAKIGDVSWPTTTSVYKVISETKGTPVKLVVQRGNEEKAFEITPRDKRLGIVMGSADPILSQPLPDFPAAKLNLPPGTKVTAINGAKVGSFTEIQQALAAAARHSPGGFEAALECEPNEGKTITPMTVKFAVDKDNAAALAHAGWESPLPTQLFVIEMVILKGETPSQAIGLGIKKTHQSMLQVYLTLLRVIQGSVHPKNFQGPVGIAHTGTIIAKQGFNYLLFFLGLISVNLAVMNFLPIPVVDGGHIVFLVIEKFKGSPVGPKIQNAALIAGLAALVCMFLYVTYNDILRLVFGAA
jgi:regulator of sigma E protease